MMKLVVLFNLCTMIAALTLLAGCGAGGNPPGSNQTNSPAGPIVVSISPKATSVALGATRQFSASATTGNVSYSITTGGAQYGTIDASGLYSAPTTMPSPSLVTIRAQSSTDPNAFDTATVTLITAPVYGNFPVRFDVKTRSGWQAQRAPVTCGIPMGDQLHSNVNTLRVQTAGGGANVDAQFRVTSRWPSGFIRWVMVDFMADLSGVGGVGQYQLNNGGSGSATGTSLSVQDNVADIVVDTGLLEFTVNKNSFNLLSSVRVDLNGNSVLDECLNTAAMEGVIVSEGADDYLMSTLAPTRVEVEEQGPLRVTIVAEGVHRSGLGVNKLHYTVRITAYDEMPFLNIDYTFKNMTDDGVPAATPAEAADQLAQYETADSVRLELPLDFQSASPTIRIAGNPVHHTAVVVPSGEHLEVYQYYAGAHDATDPENPQPAGFNVGTGDGSSEPLTDIWPTEDDTEIIYDVDDNGSVSTVNTHAPGWIQMVGGGLRVTAAMAEFWQHYPKSLRGQGDGLLSVGIWPDAAAPLQVFAGAMKTHRMLLSFDAAASLNNSVAEVRFNTLNDPPRGVCDTTHYSATNVFGQIAWTDETLTNTDYFGATSKAFAANYMQEVISHMGDLLADRTDGNGTATGHEYGMWNFGDGKHSSPVAGWENNAWGISSAAFQWFAMSGNMEILYLAETTARHFRDVDVLHADIGLRFDYTEAGNPAVSGGKASQLGKTRYFPNNKQHDLGNYHFGDNHLDVFNGAFLAEHYLLTGDATSLDVLKEIFMYLRGTWKRFFDSGNGGVDNTMDAPTTWLSNALLIASAYERANGEFDAEAWPMLQYVLGVVIDRQTTSTPNDPNGNGFADSSGDFRAWEVGHLMEALEWARFSTNNAALDPVILNGMNWLLGTNANVYLGNLPTPRFGEFAETTGGTVDFGGPNLMIGAGYIGAYRQSANNNWRAAAQNLVEKQTANIEAATIGGDAIRHSSFAQFFRAGPMLLATMN